MSNNLGAYISGIESKLRAAFHVLYIPPKRFAASLNEFTKNSQSV